MRGTRLYNPWRLPHGKLTVFFSRAISAAENKPSIVHVKLFTRFLHSDLVRQLQCLDFKVLIVPFHCLSSFLFRQFWHCTFIVSLHSASDGTYPFGLMCLQYFAALFASVSVVYPASIFSVFSLPPPISFDVLICFADELHCFFSEFFPALTSAAIYRQVVPTTLYSLYSPSPKSLVCILSFD